MTYSFFVTLWATVYGKLDCFSLSLVTSDSVLIMSKIKFTSNFLLGSKQLNILLLQYKDLLNSILYRIGCYRYQIVKHIVTFLNENLKFPMLAVCSTAMYNGTCVLVFERDLSSNLTIG